jgi:hypothetical protein
VNAVEVGTLHPSSLITGRDGGETVLAWGHEVWIFGDTFLTVKNVDGTSFVSNTFATSPSTVPEGGIPLADRLDEAGAPDELLRPTAAEEAYDVAHRMLPDGGCEASPCGGRFATWPSAAVFAPDAGGSALVFYSIVSAAPGAFNFQGIGAGVATWSSFASLPSRPAPALCDGGPPTALFCASDPGYGEGAALVDGSVYTFACTKNGLAFNCQLGRVPYAQATARSAWQFWTGSAWSSDMGSSVTLFNGAPILSFFFDPFIGQWMTVYSEPLSNQVVFRTAPALTGPWSQEGNLFVATYQDGNGGTAYDAVVHPELAEQGGKVQYVTYSRPNGTEFGDEFALVRVTFGAP